MSLSLKTDTAANSAPEPSLYEPLQLQPFTRPVFLLRSSDTRLLVDARSICEAMHVSWRVWSFQLKSNASLEPSPGIDRRGQKTLLLPAAKVSPWIDGLLRSYTIEHPALRERTQRMVIAFRSYLLDQKYADKPSTSPRARRVTADTVSSLYAAVASGMNYREAATHCKTSVATAQQVATGRYPSLDEEGRLRWNETFGSFPEPMLKRSALGARRKITADTVGHLYTALADGLDLKAAATRCSISKGSAQQIAAGTYPLDEHGRRRWHETFAATPKPEATSKPTARPNSAATVKQPKPEPKHGLLRATPASQGGNGAITPR